MIKRSNNYGSEITRTKGQDMLTFTDVHYLVGLLTLSTSPDGVEVELGSMVYDDKADEDRDVDITVTYREPDGEVRALAGREVKAHKRPLDVAHVEQLCLKLADMPSVTHKGLVSASGYTEGARKKAAAHGLELSHFREWDFLQPAMDWVRLQGPIYAREVHTDWSSGPTIKLLFPEPWADTESPEGLSERPIRSRSGGPSVWGSTAGSLCERLLLQSQAQLLQYADLHGLLPGVDQPVTITIRVDDPLLVNLSGGELLLDGAILTGSIRRTVMEKASDYRMLIREGDTVPIALCEVTEMQSGDLFGTSFITTARSINLLRIPISDRNKQKILRHRLNKPVERSAYPERDPGKERKNQALSCGLIVA